MRIVRGALRPDRLLGMVSPMIVWALYFVAVYSLAGLRCGAPPADVPQLGAHPVRWLLAGCTVLALAASAALGVRAWRAWRHAGADTGHPIDPERQRSRFMAMVMLALAAIGAIASLLTAVPMLLLETCQ